jgi:hypothetical protein
MDPPVMLAEVLFCKKRSDVVVAEALSTGLTKDEETEICDKKTAEELKLRRHLMKPQSYGWRTCHLVIKQLRQIRNRAGEVKKHQDSIF